MIISRLSVRNYKSCDDSGVDIEFASGINILIGKNNAGKSALLEALLLANPFLAFCRLDCMPQKLANDPERLITARNIHLYGGYSSDKRVEISVQFTDIDEKDRGFFGDDISDALLYCRNTDYIAYTIEYDLSEQYERPCKILRFETPKLVVTVDGDNVTRESKTTQVTEQFKYDDFFPVKAPLFTTSYDDISPEIWLLDRLSDYFSQGFIMSTDRAVGGKFVPLQFEDPSLQFLYGISRSQDIAATIDKSSGDQTWALVNKGWIEEFREFSRAILGDEQFRFVTKEYDFLRARNQPNTDDQNNRLQNEEFPVAYFYKEHTAGYGLDFESLGSGIKRALQVFWAIITSEFFTDEKQRPHGCPFLVIDEIEKNMNPRLLDQVFEQILKSSNSRQFIISTHSNFFVDSSVDHGITILRVYREPTLRTNVEKIEYGERTTKALCELGYRASNLLQCNGVIWVEGPSDIIYIQHLIRLYCIKHARSIPKKGVNYEFLIYSGANLKHHSISPFVSETLTASLISVLTIQRNYFVVFDRDYYDSDPGHGSERNKRSLIDAISNDEKWWMTQDRCLEYYLKANDLKSILSSETYRNSTEHKIKPSKTKHARRYTDACQEYEYWFRDETDLEKQIKKVVVAIESWNS